MAQNIEDPEIVRTIDDLKRRWPAIGQAADHPLLEFFIHRKTHHQRTRKWLKQIIIYGIPAFFLILSCAVYFRSFLHDVLGPIYMVLCWSIGIAVIVRKKYMAPKRKDLKYPSQLVTDAGDASQWEQLWLTPLNFRDLAGICIGFFYHAKVSRNRWLRWVVRILGGMAVLAIVFVFNLSNIVSLSMVDFFDHPFHITVSFSLFAGLIFSITRFIGNRARVIDMYMNSMQMMVLQRQRNWFSGYKSFRRQWPILFVIFAIQITFVANMVSFSNGIVFIPLECTMLVWSLIFFYISHRYSTKDMDSTFELFITREGPEYHRLICQKMGREEAPARE